MRILKSMLGFYIKYRIKRLQKIIFDHTEELQELRRDTYMGRPYSIAHHCILLEEMISEYKGKLDKMQKNARHKPGIQRRSHGE